MLIIPDEVIVFITLDSIALSWMVLKILIDHWTASILTPVPSPPRPHEAHQWTPIPTFPTAS
jgi:hypothetical protein